MIDILTNHKEFSEIKYLKAADYTTCYYMDIWKNIVNIMGSH
jgi:hypothetical protein